MEEPFDMYDDGKRELRRYRATIWCLAIIGIAMLVFALVGGAGAHTAPLGWVYSASCCSGRDCNQLPPGAVVEGPNGYEVTILPGQHNFVKDEPFRITVPYDSKKLRDAPDGLFHACLSPSLNLLCLYRGSRGF